MNLRHSKNSNILLVGAKSKPSEISGQTIAFDILVKEFSNVNNSVIDINCYSEKRLKKIYRYFKFYLLFIKKLVTKNIDKIYLTISQSKEGFVRDLGFIWIAFLFNKKIIVHLHGGNYKEFYDAQGNMFKKVIKSTLNKTNIIIVLSESFREIFSFVDNYRFKTRVVPNGIEVPLKKLQPEKELGGTIKLLYLSNLIESKGYLDVLHSAKYLKETYRISFQILFCGKFLLSQDDETFENVAEAEQYFQQYIINNNLRENVKYLGVVQGKEKEEILKQAHFILLPSYYVSEGQPISLIEGLAHGCVPVCTDYRDLRNIVLNNWNGLLVKRNSPEEIAEKIANVTNTEFLRLSKNAKQHFLNNYTLESHIRAMKNIFNEQISK